jgi:hypothetical protein
MSLIASRERRREQSERLAPQLVDALFAAPVQNQPPERERLDQAATAFLQERVFRRDFHAVGLQVHEPAEDVVRAIEQSSGQHRAFHSPLGGIRLGVVRSTGLGEAHPGNIQPVLGVIEQTPREGLNQLFLRAQSVGRNRIGLDPIAGVVDPFDLIEKPPAAVLWNVVVGRRVYGLRRKHRIRCRTQYSFLARNVHRMPYRVGY